MQRLVINVLVIERIGLGLLLWVKDVEKIRIEHQRCNVVVLF